MQKYIPFMVVAVLTSALLLKTIRYLDAAPADRELSVSHELSSFMAHYDWLEKSDKDAPDHSLFRSLTYAKPGCDHSLTIAVLSDNTELRNFVNTALGDDLTIFQDSAFSDNQRAFRLGLEPALNSTLNFFGNPGHGRLPPLAISPAPSEKDAPCAPPAKKHWKNWFDEH